MRIFCPLSICLFFITACGGSGGAITTSPSPANTVITPIHSVQGSGNRSPLAGQQITVRGIVTGDFQNGDADTANNLGGFFLQEEIRDADVLTSDGVFVFDDMLGVDVKPGDEVLVSGSVEEFFGETQIAARDMQIVGSGSIVATDVSLPTVATIENSNGTLLADLERYEGMLLRFPQALTVVDAFNLERYGSVTVAAGGRIMQFTNSNAPDSVAFAVHKKTVARSSTDSR